MLLFGRPLTLYPKKWNPPPKEQTPSYGRKKDAILNLTRLTWIIGNVNTMLTFSVYIVLIYHLLLGSSSSDGGYDILDARRWPGKVFYC